MGYCIPPIDVWDAAHPYYNLEPGAEGWAGCQAQSNLGGLTMDAGRLSSEVVLVDGRK